MSGTDPDALGALARSRAWALLGEFFARGLTEATLPTWRQVEGGILGEDPSVSVDLTAAAEAHTRLCVLEIPPFESAFLGTDGLLAGEVAASVRAARGLAGLGDPQDGEPDHLAAELSWLAFLTGAEADARRDGVDPAPLVALQRAAVNQHLLRWVPAWAVALEGLLGPHPGAAERVHLRAARLTVALLAGCGATPGDRAAWDLPGAVDVLADPRTGLRAVAEHLALPCQAGGFLARGVILGVARRLDLPATFGSRADMIEGLLRAAAQYSMIPEVCGALRIVCGEWRSSMVSMSGDPEGAWWSRPWDERIARTEGMLERMSRSAAR